MTRLLGNIPPYSVGIFLFVMPIMLVVSAIIWEQNINDKLYHCTDSVGLPDFVLPGWVHGSVEYVQEIDVRRSMSLPDEVKEGWSVDGLWYLWFGFLIASAGISCAVASIPWAFRRSRTKGI